MLFSGYLSNPEATRQSFTSDGFFCTGDIAVTEPVTGNDGCAIDYYRLLGRQSVDIIKTGGYKVSAIEIEQTILNHPEVREVCVVGLPNETYGQIICAVIVPKTKGKLIPEGVQRWLRETAQLSSYKLPRQIIIRNEIPRNQLGKINKRNIARELS
jgi:malonyl-CoA/methylmalonyl-CoA synthetase